MGPDAHHNQFNIFATPLPWILCLFIVRWPLNGHVLWLEHKRTRSLTSERSIIVQYMHTTKASVGIKSANDDDFDPRSCPHKRDQKTLST